MSGTACGMLYAGLALAGALPARDSPRSWLLPLASALVTLAAARWLLGLWFESDPLFVWCPAGVGAVAGAAAGHQMLPQGSDQGSR